MIDRRPPLRIYLSGPFAWRERLIDRAAELERAGHSITSRWLEQDLNTPEALAVEVAVDSMPTAAAYFAEVDYADVAAADVLIAFTAPSALGPARGGRHVEFGLALAWGKSLIVIGPYENVFHRLSSGFGIRAQFDDWCPQIYVVLGDIRDQS